MSDSRKGLGGESRVAREMKIFEKKQKILEGGKKMPRIAFVVSLVTLAACTVVADAAAEVGRKSLQKSVHLSISCESQRISNQEQKQQQCTQDDNCCASDGSINVSWEVAGGIASGCNQNEEIQIVLGKDGVVVAKGVKGTATIDPSSAGKSVSVSVQMQGKILATQQVSICDSSSTPSAENAIQFLWPLQGMMVPATPLTLEVRVNGVDISQGD